MANKNLLTYGAKFTQVKQSYYAPVAVVPTNTSTPLNSTYCFLARADNWVDENNPPQPTQDQKSLKYLMKNIFAVKQLTSGNISPVIQRIDWTTGTIYDYYQDDVDMFEMDENGFLVKFFYVKNHYDQVFKCLWNNNGVESTDEPFFEPGSFNTNNIYTGPNDGYKWKFMYTIDTGLKVRFMDSTWMPVAVGENTPNSLETTAGAGNIDVINVTDGGSNYNPTLSPIYVTVTGDGSGAAGSAVVEDGVITSISVTNSGSNYTYSNVAITSATGSGALAIAPTSPIGGHGYDNASELGCNHVMITTEFVGDEGGLVPTDITFHQIGLLTNPTTNTLSPLAANGSIYKTTTDLILAPGFGQFTFDDIVYQGDSLENATFIGTVLSFDVASNVLRLINTTGTIRTNATVYDNVSKTARTVLTYNTPNFTLLSGYVSYVENRTGVQRSTDGIEQFKLVIGY